jgi:transcriptional regulator GlxA family with amidase domain
VSSRQRFGFLLLPRFSLLSLGGALEALAAADEALGDVRHMAVTLSIDGAAVRGSTGTVLRVDHGIADAPPLDAVFVVADLPLPEAGRDGHVAALHPWLRARGAGGATLGGIGTGAVVLAQAGLLDGHRATLPAAHVAQLSAAHAAVVWSSNLYEIDRGRLTCAGAAASLDMTLAWLGQRHGERLAQTLVTQFGLERLRAGDERQTAPLAARIGAGSAKLAEALSLMEANLGEPLPTEDIAQLVGVSRRQLERLFKQHLDELPSRYYAELRLARARRLLQQTSQSILQIGLACGFSSGSHFSNAYRARFARTPREERSQRAAAWRDNVGAAPAAAPPQEELTR